MTENSVEKNYIYNLIYHMLVMAIPLIVTPYVGRVLGAEGVGAFSYTTAMTGYFLLFGNLGVATYGQLKIAGERNDKYLMSKTFHELAFLRIVLMTIALGLFFAFVFGFSQANNRTLYVVLIVQIIAAMFDIAWFLQGIEEFKKIVLRNTIIKLISVVLIFWFVKKPSDLYLYALILNGSTLLGNLSIWLFMPSFIEIVPFKDLQPFIHLKECITYFIPTIATTIYLTLDKTMIGWLTSTNVENGYYEQAHKIEQMAVTVVTSLSVVTMPRMAYLFKNDETETLKKRLEQSIRFILMIAIPMCLGMAAVSDYFIPLYLGKDFLPSVVLLQVFSFLLIVVGLNNAVGKQVLMPMGRQNKYNISVIIGAITNFILNFLLIPRLYAVGAAIASVTAETVILAVFLHYSKDMITWKWIIVNSLKYIVAGVLMFVIIRLSYIVLPMHWLSIVLQVVVGIIVYFLAVFSMRDHFAVEGLHRILEKVKR